MHPYPWKLEVSSGSGSGCRQGEDVVKPPSRHIGRYDLEMARSLTSAGQGSEHLPEQALVQ